MVSAGYGFSHAVAYEDKSLFKAARLAQQGSCEKLYSQASQFDKTASWSKSGYHGWVYGYLHLTFPVMFDIPRMSMNAKCLIKNRSIVVKGKVLIADAGYRDQKRQVPLQRRR